VQEDVCDIEDPFAFIGMVPALEEDRLWAPADGLVRVDRHNRDGVLVVLHVLRGEMGGKPEDLPGVPVIPVKVEGLVDGTANRLDPERLPAHGTDQPDPLVPVTDDQEVAIEGIVQGSGNAGIPDRREVLGFIHQDRIPHNIFAGEEIYFIYNTKRSEQVPFHDDHDKESDTGSGSFRRRKKIPGNKKKTRCKGIFRPAPGLEDRYPGTQRRVA